MSFCAQASSNECATSARRHQTVKAVLPGGGKLAPYESVSDPNRRGRPAITMPELAARLLEEHGIVAAPAMLSRLPVPARLHL